MTEWEVVDKNHKSNEELKIIIAFVIGFGIAILGYWLSDSNYYICTEYQKICVYEECTGICFLPNSLVCDTFCVKWKINEDALPKNKTSKWISWDESQLYDNYTHYGTNSTIIISNITTTTIPLTRCISISDCDKNMSLPGCKPMDCNTCCCSPDNTCMCTLVYCADFCGLTYNGTDFVKTNKTRVWNKDTGWWECK
jgi:hypothetical protein